jgi:hypothetical protein
MSEHTYNQTAKRIALAREKKLRKAIEQRDDLLAALKIIRDGFWTNGETGEERVDDLKRVADAAIEKAEGK